MQCTISLGKTVGIRVLKTRVLNIFIAAYRPKTIPLEKNNTLTLQVGNPILEIDFCGVVMEYLVTMVNLSWIKIHIYKEV